MGVMSTWTKNKKKNLQESKNKTKSIIYRD